MLQVSLLASIFPDIDRDTCVLLLRSCGWDVEESLGTLLGGDADSSGSRDPSPRESSRQRQSLSPRGRGSSVWESKSRSQRLHHQLKIDKVCICI